MEIPEISQQQMILLAIAGGAIIALILVIAGIRTFIRRRQQARLKSRFGPEYDQAVKSEGVRHAVDDLKGRIEDREKFSPVDPGEETRAELRRRMANLQYRFVEDPPDVLLETERAVLDALRACGYPVAEERERALKLLSVDYPDVTPSLRTLLEGSYGRDANRLQALFLDARRALRDIVHFTYSPDDLHGPITHAEPEPGRPPEKAAPMPASPGTAGGETPPAAGDTLEANKPESGTTPPDR